jgi:hypothetical protein
LVKPTEEEARVARNESVFRHVNERIAETAESGAWDATHFVCECDDPACQHRLELPLEQYEQVRTDSAQFIVAHGHDNPDHEAVVRRRPSYAVVRKLGQRVVAMVRRSDPRSDVNRER